MITLRGITDVEVDQQISKSCAEGQKNMSEEHIEGSLSKKVMSNYRCRG
jgi:hypothetical protein